MTQREELSVLAARVPDGSSLAIGGTLFSRMPVALLRAVCAAGPRSLHYISWGGGFPLEMLLEAGAVERVTLCFSSLDVFGPAPRFREAIESGQIELVELSAHALVQGLSAGRRRLPSEPMIWPRGSDLTSLPGFPAEVSDPVTGERVGAVGAIRPDVLLLHAQAADDAGNIEIVGARGLDLTLVAAARTVLVTVDEIVPRERLGMRRQAVVIPHHLISAFAVIPGGAAPTSSLPLYMADYDGIARWSRAESAIAGAGGHGIPIPRELPALVAGELGAIVPAIPSDAPATVDEWMTCWLARQYDDESVCSVGAVSPLASASYLLAKAMHAPGLTLITNGGSFVDVAARPLLFGLGEWLDACSATAHTGGEESYELFYQPGRVSHEVVSVAQIDARGRTNNRSVTSSSGRLIRLPGQGGMADVADMHRNFLIYLPRQSTINTPEAVAFTTAARSLASDADRTAAGYRPGRVQLITNLAVFGLDPATDRLRVEAVFPGASFDDLIAATGFDLGLASLDGIPMVDPPSEHELRTLRERVDPLGIRRLEFVSSRERGPLLDQVIAAERAVVDATLARAREV